ncbi:MAG TPA: hypothetical protein VJR89_30495 [Polyangiales bacterium]|nr:hypothetical protein [Polyangiales bacterium]
MFSTPPLTPLVKKLIIGLLVAFVLELILLNFAHINVIALFGLDPVGLGPLTLVQLASHVLLEYPQQGQWVLINLVFMWLILSPFEVTFGSKPTLQLIGWGILAAAVAVIVVGLIAGTPVPGYRYVGSSAITYVGLAAMTQVVRSGRIMFFGVLPMTPRQLLLVVAGFALLNFLITTDYLALAGSIAAIAAGVGYVRYMARAPRPPRGKRSAPPRFRVLRGGGGDGEGDRPKWLN